LRVLALALFEFERETALFLTEFERLASPLLTEALRRVSLLILCEFALRVFPATLLP